ncbi:hypothetical protein AGR3A_Cc40037 [Agrobacterium tomkonis CFBP 6623]|uniref:Uncharacterized protein n=1 Tax=Agrobacterium tomkonis CFBP 6623 TaxID=1183432 RepID=A0A1S7Q3N2_9HYPH|nr:hypothetical protein AGR3A_Cc40037 [Agrobacterium tomkonis CFBP 6623]
MRFRWKSFRSRLYSKARVEGCVRRGHSRAKALFRLTFIPATKGARITDSAENNLFTFG